MSLERGVIEGLIFCDTCGNACGFLWPMATDCCEDHYFVERCDLCDRFEDDEAAWKFLVERLTEQGYTFDSGWAYINSIEREAPYIENVREPERVPQPKEPLTREQYDLAHQMSCTKVGCTRCGA